MKKIENLLLKACGYSLIILTLFFAVAALGNFTSAAIDFPTFLLIFVFGIIISTASMILYVQALKPIFRVMIHYAILLISFSVIFILAGKLGNGGASVIFSAIVIFTFLYAVIFAVTYLIRRAIKSADKALDKKNSSSSKGNKNKPYTPLYKKD